ncbi:hypothetical protein [Pseudoalteromonas luteoviolacea]|uniref:Uncharacterized protein n=1 Tax=Pseudoalteromonas luteoviolacea NCIMB 1942 TaxID=1365253 RepID=A0A166ZDC7_9GAMM|nr:hypothetical protein [Pseudoalteromonas luteoviolacea]KZN44195.1 hypothetical protein N482_17515 [Pseudoalteromonas luteoviolacea NCIMB 1942]
MLIVHNSQDKIVPFRMVETRYARENGDKELLEVNGKHIAALLDLP